MVVLLFWQKLASKKEWICLFMFLIILRRKTHIIYIEEDIDDFEYDDEYDEIYPQDYEFSINQTLRKESKYKTKEDISKAFKLLLHELLYVTSNTTIQQYLTQSDVTYLPEDYQDKNYLLISTLLFKINSFYKGKLNTSKLCYS